MLKLTRACGEKPSARPRLPVYPHLTFILVYRKVGGDASLKAEQRQCCNIIDVTEIVLFQKRELLSHDM